MSGPNPESPIHPLSGDFLRRMEANRQNPEYMAQTVFGGELLSIREEMGYKESASVFIKPEIQKLRTKLKKIYGNGNAARSQYVINFFEETLTKKDRKNLSVE